MNPIDAKRWKTRSGLAYGFADGKENIVPRGVHMLQLHRYLKNAGICREERCHGIASQAIRESRSASQRKVRGSCVVGAEAVGAVFKRRAVGLDRCD